MRVLVCGDRNWTDKNLIAKVLMEVFPASEMPYRELHCVIEGGARGADRIAGEIAKSWSIPLEVYTAKWKKFGKRAGPIRNQDMLRWGKPDLVLAFHDNIQMSKGTSHMIEIAEEAGIEVRLIHHE